MKRLFLQIKEDILSKSVSKKMLLFQFIKESMNKSSSKNVFLRFQLFTLLHILVAACRGVFRTQLNIYDEVFFAKIVGKQCFQLLTTSQNKLHCRCSTGLNIHFWLTKIPETEFLEKNNATGNDLSVLHFDQNFRRNF